MHTTRLCLAPDWGGVRLEIGSGRQARSIVYIYIYIDFVADGAHNGLSSRFKIDTRRLGQQFEVAFENYTLSFTRCALRSMASPWYLAGCHRLAEPRSSLPAASTSSRPPLNHAAQNACLHAVEPTRALDDVPRSPSISLWGAQLGLPMAQGAQAEHKRHPHGPLLSDAYDAAGDHCRLSTPPPRCHESSGQPGARMVLLIGLVSSFVLVNHEQMKGALGSTKGSDSRGTPLGVYTGATTPSLSWCSRSFPPSPALRRVYPRPCAQSTTQNLTPTSIKTNSSHLPVSPQAYQKGRHEEKKGTERNVPPAAMARPGFCHVLASVLLLAATVLFIVASVSAPVVNGLGVLVVRLPREVRGDTVVTLGTFGHCVENGDE